MQENYNPANRFGTHHQAKQDSIQYSMVLKNQKNMELKIMILLSSMMRQDRWYRKN